MTKFLAPLAISVAYAIGLAAVLFTLVFAPIMGVATEIKGLTAAIKESASQMRLGDIYANTLVQHSSFTVDGDAPGLAIRPDDTAPLPTTKIPQWRQLQQEIHRY